MFELFIGKRTWAPLILSTIVVVFLAFYRLHNVLSFNPYWGYDGGGHLNYILSLAEHNRFPSIETNDVAWHEPLWYFFMAGIAKIVLLFSHHPHTLFKSLGIVQVILSLATSFVIWKLISLLLETYSQRLITFLTLTFLTAFNQASTFLTNELANYFFIILLLYFSVDTIQTSRLDQKRLLTFGILSGLALLNKITAIIPIFFVVCLILLLSYQQRRWNGKKIVLSFILPILLLFLPWQWYRATHLFGGVTVNNPHLLTPAPLILDERVHFYTWFDTDIFRFPYWYSGGRAFWSMLYADSFYDYYGSIENDDLLPNLADGDRIKTTHLNTYVTKQHLGYSTKLVWLGLLPLFVMLLGLGAMAYLMLKKDLLGWYGAGITSGFFAAMIYFSYRYPYYDMGIVKSIFIYPVYIFPVIYGVKAFEILKRIHPLVANVLPFIVLLPYLLVVIPAFWIDSFGY